MAIGDVIRVVKTEKGSVDYLTLFEDSLEGPYVLYNYSDNWYTRFTDSADIKLVRNGEKSDLTAFVNNFFYFFRVFCI